MELFFQPVGFVFSGCSSNLFVEVLFLRGVVRLSGLVSGFNEFPGGVGDPWLLGFVECGGDVWELLWIWTVAVGPRVGLKFLWGCVDGVAVGGSG